MNFNPLDQQLKNPGLLIREELIPNRIHILKSLPDLVFRYCLVLFVGLTPGGNYDFGRTKQAPNDAAKARGADCVNALDELFEGAAFLLAPSTTAEAPRIEDGTGSPDLSRAWTLLGLPSITLPIGAGPNGLPLGLQVAARLGGDLMLLQAAAWIEAEMSKHLNG